MKLLSLSNFNKCSKFMTKQAYLDPTQEQGRDFFLSGISGAVTMLNLLKFRDVADYSQHGNLAPESPITGEQAYLRYMQHTMPFLLASGGELLFYGDGKKLLASGGRVLTVTGIGSDLTEARNQAYRAISQIKLTNSFYRSDIALNASVAEKGN